MKINKKALFSLIAAVALSIGASAAFTKTATYTDGMFADVPASEWYAKEVKSTYELGLMNGKGAGVFAPEGEVTVAEALTLCARVLSIYNGEAAPTNSTTGNWYDSYVQYGLTKGYLKEGQFDSYDRSIKRSEMATLFYDAMPEGFYKRINNVTYIPDVDKNDACYNKLLNLYNAGIVMGNDAYGNFNPSSSIIRSEVAAIINRVAVEENRVRRALAVATPKVHGATYDYIDALDMGRGHGTKLASGWDYDNRASFTNVDDTQTATLSDIFAENSVSIKREINPLTSGNFELETRARTSTTKGGFYFLLTDDNGLDVIRVFGKDGFYYIKSGDKEFNTGKEISAEIYFTVKGNLDTDRADFYVDSKVVSSFDITDKADKITKYIIGTTDEAKLNLTVKKVQLYSDYLVNDIFASSPEGVVPSDWVTNGASVKYSGGFNSTYDKNSMIMNATAGVNSYAKRYFEAASGKLVFKTYIHTPTAVSGVYVSAKCGDTEVVKVMTDGNKFVTATGETLRTHRDNLWQTVRIEADTATQKAVISIDGKKVGEVAFAAAVNYFDNIEIGATPSADTTLTFDDVVVYTVHDYEDYVPVPVPAVSEGYDIGVQICSLWRNGGHHGWDTVSNFEELETVLGYYDEGLVEVADWEIKMMVEHGIDFQHYCWYCPSNDIKEPIKPSGAALHDGYFNARYSDMIKFNIMWENGNGNLKSGGLEQFKEYIWPYWLEYYFSDPRYMTVDNKIILTVWSYTHFIQDFGGAEGAAKAVEFMDADIKNYGFDGIVVIFHDSHNMNKSVFETMKAAGVHGTYSYNLNRTGYDPEYQIERHKTQRATGVLHNTANIGVGFNDVGWNKNRSPLITLADYEKVALFMRDTYLPETKDDGTPWHSNLVFLSTWNEYGEGHYIMPCEGHVGFGYLDVIRKVFTKADANHTDVKPTDAQKARINQLYPKNRSIIDRLYFEKENLFERVSVSTLEMTEDTIRASHGLVDDKIIIENGVISGKSKGADHGIATKTPLSIDAEIADTIHIRMKATNTEKQNIEVFFTTVSSPGYTQANSQRVNIEKEGEYVDLYLDMSVIKGWQGTVTGLRIDPTNAADSEFEIALIEFMGKDQSTVVKLNINGDEIKNLHFTPTCDDAKNVMVALDIGSGVMSRMGLYHEYSRFTKTLLLKSLDHEILLTEGKNTAVFDGKEVTMPFTYTVRDGLPYVALDYLAKLFGNTVELKDNVLSIVTVSAKYLDAIKNNVPFHYEFNKPGDSEGWTPSSVSLDVYEDGYMTGVTTIYEDRPGFYDPNFYSPELNILAESYPTVEIRMKWNDIENPETEDARLYFTTETEGLSELRAVKVKYSDVTLDDEGFAIFKFDMSSNEQWKGKIIKVRLDALNRPGSVQIDYIRFIADANASIVGDMGASLINGNAEDVNNVAFGDDNTKITIVKDPENDKNHCYSVIHPERNKQTWTYFTQGYTFEPGATYLVEFDVKAMETNDGNKNVNDCYININFIYTDATGERNHFINACKVSTADGWVHVSKEMTVLPEAEGFSGNGDKFAVYSNPVGGFGVNYYMDNISLTKIS